MKRRLVGRERIKTGLFLIGLIILVGLAFLFFLFVIIKPQQIIAPLILSIVIPVGLILVTIFVMKEYFGTMSIDHHEITLTRFNKKYTFSDSQLCYICPNLEMTTHYTLRKIYSVKIRLKGQKDPLPIKITDVDLIKYLLSHLNCKIEPEGFKFDWKK